MITNLSHYNLFKILTILLFLFSCTTYRFDQIREHENKKDEEYLIQALNKSKSGYIRAQAAQSLGRLKSKNAVDSLIKTLNDPEWSVRLYSAEALGKIGDSKALNPLQNRLKIEEDEHVIFTIKKALKILGK